MNRGLFMHRSRRLALAMALGLVGAVSIVAVFIVAIHYVAPARNATPPELGLRPIIEDGWIKMPFDIVRDRECLANSTVTFRRKHDYQDVYGVREDVVTIGLYNTTITGIGKTAVMLWFRLPPNLKPGAWAYDNKIQDDCGGLGDLFNFAQHRPRRTVVPSVLIIPENGS